ncbi:putative ORFan [Tupanvirus deep ocean]|uniref:ORFan n=2 Tax=Tupanvirus TaxID=2094720 RepID=A0AC62A9X3_9VIRU|nr:putative ORFan [Tupanvirus deep ocean]QKU34524.1 putative ORFan [Tupanvirus deep ocean]
MSCPQDSYYTTNQQGSCGACGGLYDGAAGTHWCACGHCGQPGCCPAGTYHTGHQSSCGRALCAWDCLPPEPSMNQSSQINCCTGTNLPNNTPNGYCATGWCPNSANCISFMTSYCTGSNLQSNACTQFCRNNPGKCDQALTSYCSDPNNYTKPVCGCALPNSQYAILQALTPEGLAVPITCDQRCGTNNAAIRLQGQQDCNINAICVVNLSDVNVISQQVQSGITINQDCGQGPAAPNVTPGPNITPGPPEPSDGGFIQNFRNFIGTTLGKVVLVVIIFLILILIVYTIYSSTRKKGKVKIK